MDEKCKYIIYRIKGGCLVDRIEFGSHGRLNRRSTLLCFSFFTHKCTPIVFVLDDDDDDVRRRNISMEHS